jgi:hypothetical protein
MVEGATALKKVCGMNEGRKHKKQYEGGSNNSFWHGFLLEFVVFRLLSWLLMNSDALITWPSSYVNHCKNRDEDDAEG